ncbi:hypothetical protein RKE29_05820 [Streptomyces sp. B1866]|uniref:hypothetical protein n=1 Tax=Streptomyces sp. B1866 TaxID=3075431 RepID=UPI00288F1794|nr:hypothetical protein [Streptomyces sp. B1866]MDT3396162.1 hypothetical protein [Streptomyces sp. B1866]
MTRTPPTARLNGCTPPATDTPAVVTGITPGLTVRTHGTPSADWLCACGHHEHAHGRDAELTTRVRVGTCPHTTPSTTATAARSERTAA